ncbi:interferon-related developmental regulator 2 [Toxorhynchites rutilus septentrionalis]|uniref:interferon-related developmental regulator 2 n=1 Tax=Toxorhynchites rutilus septentrionalis TaxID=329112 RepID=UPI00247AE2D1|nr:interferon-related developmental regulator 2 [Toxorhynchites rutilus septentrionalis]
MPRNRKKQAANGNSHHFAESDDELSNDNASVHSYQSDYVNDAGNNNNNNNNGNDTDGGEGGGFEKYEEKLLQAIENASDKSLQTRINAFQAINDVLVHHYIPDTIESRKMTLVDAIEKSIKKGKGAEQAWAARIIPLLVIQLEEVDDINELIKVLKPVLLAVAQDTAASHDARAKCCMALGLLNFLGSDDIGDLLPLMKSFEGIFSGSYLKGDNTPSSANADAAALHSSALNAWALLLTLVPSGDLVSLVNSNNAMIPSIQKLVGMLQSPHLDVRMAAGETIALILESGRSHDDGFLDEELSDLIEATKKLATDAHKYRAKRDRKVQRATFRDVHRYLEEDISPEICIKFGKEALLLDTWSLHHQYICLRNALGFGMNVHLSENGFLRDVLQLGARLDDVQGNAKMAKAEKKFINAAAFKVRTITRGKNRDKRSAVIN